MCARRRSSQGTFGSAQAEGHPGLSVCTREGMSDLICSAWGPGLVACPAGRGEPRSRPQASAQTPETARAAPPGLGGRFGCA